MNKEFKSYKVVPAGIAAIASIRELFDKLLNDVLAEIPAAALPPSEQNGRELALMRTKLEEASFYANKAAAIAYSED